MPRKQDKGRGEQLKQPKIERSLKWRVYNQNTEQQEKKKEKTSNHITRLKLDILIEMKHVLKENMRRKRKINNLVIYSNLS